MNVYPMIELAVVGSAVGISTLLVARRLAPRPFIAWQAALVQRLNHRARARWLQKLAKWLTPQTGNACGDACSRCGHCADMPSATPTDHHADSPIVKLNTEQQEHPLRFHARIERPSRHASHHST